MKGSVGSHTHVPPNELLYVNFDPFSKVISDPCVPVVGVGVAEAVVDVAVAVPDVELLLELSLAEAAEACLLFELRVSLSRMSSIVCCYGDTHPTPRPTPSPTARSATSPSKAQGHFLLFLAPRPPLPHLGSFSLNAPVSVPAAPAGVTCPTHSSSSLVDGRSVFVLFQPTVECPRFD